MALHGEVGPARTTIEAIAARAGVSRPTVYSHFPDDRALFRACTSHWTALNPPPALDKLQLEQALVRLYGWYSANERMLSHGSRDVELLPALAEVLADRDEGLDRVRDDLTRAVGARGTRNRRIRAAVGHALQFRTWRSLVREQGLEDREAAALMAALVRSARA